MIRRPRRGMFEAGRLSAGLALAALVLMTASLCQVLMQGNP